MADARPPIRNEYFELLTERIQKRLRDNLKEVEDAESEMFERYQAGEYEDFRYDLKHMKVDNFIETWNDMVKELSDADLQTLIDSHYFKHLGYWCNWTLMSRKFDMGDSLFIETFGHIINYDFAKKYNSTWNKYERAESAENVPPSTE